MNKKILVCDDDQGVIEMMEILLSAYGYQIITENDSVHLLEKVRATTPDLILLDLWMPVLSGDIVLKNLRLNQHLHKIPVIIISASQDGEKIAAQSGADDFIGKPFELDALIGKINRLIS